MMVFIMVHFYQQSGKYDLYITLNKEVLNGFPKEFVVEDTGKADSQKSTFICDKDLSKIKAGEERVIIVESRDKFGNIRKDTSTIDKFAARITSKNKNGIIR